MLCLHSFLQTPSWRIDCIFLSKHRFWMSMNLAVEHWLCTSACASGTCCVPGAVYWPLQAVLSLGRCGGASDAAGRSWLCNRLLEGPLALTVTQGGCSTALPEATMKKKSRTIQQTATNLQLKTCSCLGCKHPGEHSPQHAFLLDTGISVLQSCESDTHLGLTGLAGMQETAGHNRPVP